MFIQIQATYFSRSRKCPKNSELLLSTRVGRRHLEVARLRRVVSNSREHRAVVNSPAGRLLRQFNRHRLFARRQSNHRGGQRRQILPGVRSPRSGRQVVLPGLRLPETSQARHLVHHLGLWRLLVVRLELRWRRLPLGSVWRQLR